MKKVIAAFLVLLVVLGVVVYFAPGKQETGDGEDTSDVAQNSESGDRVVSATQMNAHKEKRAMMLKQAMAAMARNDKNRNEQKSAEPANQENSGGGNVGDKFNPKDVQYDIEKLEEHLEGGEKNEEWQAEVEAHVNELFDTMRLKGSSVASVECTTTLCKMRLRHDDHAAFQQFGAVKNFDGPWDKGDRVGTLSINDDALYTRLFFSKEGTKLPTD